MTSWVMTEPIKFEWYLNTYGSLFEIREASLSDCLKNQQSFPLKTHIWLRIYYIFTTEWNIQHFEIWFWH